MNIDSQSVFRSTGDCSLQETYLFYQGPEEKNWKEIVRYGNAHYANLISIHILKTHTMLYKHAIIA